jgi:hypothetical protein
MPDPPSRIEHIASEARYDVEVQVCDCLTGRGSGVEPDVVAVRPVHGIKMMLDDIDQSQQPDPLLRRGIPPGFDHPVGNNQRVPWRDREAICNGKADLIRGDPLLRRNGEKR